MINRWRKSMIVHPWLSGKTQTLTSRFYAWRTKISICCFGSTRPFLPFLLFKFPAEGTRRFASPSSCSSSAYRKSSFLSVHDEEAERKAVDITAASSDMSSDDLAWPRILTTPPSWCIPSVMIFILSISKIRQNYRGFDMKLNPFFRLKSINQCRSIRLDNYCSYFLIGKRTVDFNA